MGLYGGVQRGSMILVDALYQVKAISIVTAGFFTRSYYIAVRILA